MVVFSSMLFGHVAWGHLHEVLLMIGFCLMSVVLCVFLFFFFSIIIILRCSVPYTTQQTHPIVEKNRRPGAVKVSLLI